MACSRGRAGVLTTRAAVLAGRDLGCPVLTHRSPCQATPARHSWTPSLRLALRPGQSQPVGPCRLHSEDQMTFFVLGPVCCESTAQTPSSILPPPIPLNSVYARAGANEEVRPSPASAHARRGGAEDWAGQPARLHLPARKGRGMQI